MKQLPRTALDINDSHAWDRETLLARWFSLTREILPAMAPRHRWPIRDDHCFMRVCLDEALGAPWPSVVSAPAYRNLTDAQLARAVAVAKTVAAAPEMLPSLNAQSLRARAAWRAAGRQNAR